MRLEKRAYIGIGLNGLDGRATQRKLVGSFCSGFNTAEKEESFNCKFRLDLGIRVTSNSGAR